MASSSRKSQPAQAPPKKTSSLKPQIVGGKGMATTSGGVRFAERPAAKPSLSPMHMPKTDIEVAQQQQQQQLDALVLESGTVYVEKHGRKYPEKEMSYTDKDRAAAVAMGSRDIKVSLQVKKKREKKQDEPGEREFQIRYALVEKEMRLSNPSRSLQFINKAMEFRPNSKECYVARSRCYLMLGQVESALTDAETALNINKEYVKAIFAKAEALYARGDFEFALVYYHRGRNLRPELEEFRYGIQKAEEAILNAIGDSSALDLKISETNEDSTENWQASPEAARESTSSSAMPDGLEKLDHLSSLGDLHTDIDFMRKLITSPKISDMKSPTYQKMKQHVDEALEFLQSRSRFWSQQCPRNHRISSPNS